jgi:hypothetical protein
MHGTSSTHFGPIREAALASLGEAYSAEDIHYELAFANAEEHRLSMGQFLMGSDYDAVPRQAILQGLDPYANAGKMRNYGVRVYYCVDSSQCPWCFSRRLCSHGHDTPPRPVRVRGS